MKEDYLWDKTGAGDPEIERLENALAVFRYQATEPPALPAMIIPFEKKTPRSFFRLAFTFAACATLVIVSLGVWFQFSGEKLDVVKNSSEKIAPQATEKATDETTVKKPENLNTEKTKTRQQFAEPKIVKIRKTAPAVIRQNKAVAQSAFKKPAVELTKEEKYAYDRLMLALSITSSKFRLVKDKVEGVEAENAVRKSGR